MTQQLATALDTLSRIEPKSMVAWSPRQLDTIKRTVAKDTNEDEFNLFIEYAKVKQLDPFSKQVIAVVFNKDKPEKRQMSIITTQEGYRSLAARCGDYRPAEEEPEFTYEDWFVARKEHLREASKILNKAEREAKIKEIDENFPIDPLNPDGIDKCTVTLWKQDPKTSQWHKVNGWARWRDYAPIKEEWGENENGKWARTGRKVLDTSGNWGRMGHVMIAKCATSAALRAGWPAVFGNVYSEEEFERAKVLDLTASEIVAKEAEERRAKAIGMAQNEIPWVDNSGTLHFIAAGQFGDTILREAGTLKTKAQFDGMMIRNREGMQRFWVVRKDDALQVKKELEEIADALPAVDAEAQAGANAVEGVPA